MPLCIRTAEVNVVVLLIISEPAALWHNAFVQFLPRALMFGHFRILLSITAVTCDKNDNITLRLDLRHLLELKPAHMFSVCPSA